MLDPPRDSPASGIGLRAELHDERLRVRERRGVGPVWCGAFGPLMSSVVRHASSANILPTGAPEVPREPSNLSKTSAPSAFDLGPTQMPQGIAVANFKPREGGPVNR